MSKLEITIDSCSNKVNLVGECISILASQAFDKSSRNQIQTCVVEAVNNCIEHSYKMANGHTIFIKCEIDDNRLIVAISDTGVAMDPQIFDKIKPDFGFDLTDIDNIPDGGWGIKTIKSWMDESKYLTEDGVNHLIMVKYLPK